MSATTNQLTFLIESLNTFEQVDCFAIVSEQDIITHSEVFERDYQSLDKFVYSNESYEEFTAFDVVILPESNVTIYAFIPPSVVKVGLPHGTDVPVYATMFTYGGGFCFDYILSATKQPLLTENVYKDTFAKRLRTQQSSSVTLVPFGSPKLDAFIETVFKLNAECKTSIIYHLSLLSIEEPWVEDAMLDVLRRLLIAFTDRMIIFRVHHLDRKNPSVKKCVEMGSLYMNFCFSTDDSYVNDYALGAMMVLHREYESHLFELATGSPTLLVTEIPYQELRYGHNERYFVAPISIFIDVAQDVVRMPFDRTRKNIEKYCREVGIYNPGKSIASLVECLPILVSRDKLDSWVCYQFGDSSNTDIDSKLLQLVISKRTFGHYAFAYASYASHSPISLLLLAEHFVRHNTMKSYFYPHALRCFYQLLCHREYSQISELAELWWCCKGRASLTFCLELAESCRLERTFEISQLEKFCVSLPVGQKDYNVDESQIRIINLNSRKPHLGEELIIVGISELTEMILHAFGGSVVAVFDDANIKSCTEYLGKRVYNLSDITEFSQSIVIATHNGLVSMVNKLKLELNVTNEIYGVLDDFLLGKMVDMIPKIDNEQISTFR